MQVLSQKNGYLSGMPTATQFFAPWEAQSASITDWQGMLDQINRVITFVQERTLAWRGLSSAEYTVHSTLYRHLSSGGAVNEANLVDFESRMLKVARTQWRFDNLGALEILAQLQHLGAPTRLLDVTFNPLVALWFAVEPKYKSGSLLPEVDGRLIAYDVTGRQIGLTDEWGGRDLPWLKAPEGWRDELPRVWRPPSYNARIPAQDSAFLLGGVPAGSSRFYRKHPGDSTRIAPWRIEQVRAITSVPMKMWALGNRSLYPRSTPTLTIRIPAEAKADVRNVLDRRFGINTSSVYPDMYGLAQRGWRHLAL